MHSSMPYEEVTKEICFSMFMSLQKNKGKKKREKKKKMLKKKRKKNKKKQKKRPKKRRRRRRDSFVAFEGASIEVHYSYNLLKAFYAPWFTMLLP